MRTRTDPDTHPTTPLTFPGKYLSITSFRTDGTGVATPVWFVQQDGEFLAETDDNTYKVKRIMRDPSVQIAPCDARGRLIGVPISAWARILPEADLARVQELLARKYRVAMVFFKPIRSIQSALHIGRPRGNPVALAITPLG